MAMASLPFIIIYALVISYPPRMWADCPFPWSAFLVGITKEVRVMGQNAVNALWAETHQIGGSFF